MYSRKCKGGMRWYSDFIYEGKRYKKSWGIVPKTIAKEKEMKFRSDVARGKYEGRKKNILFEKLVEKYLEYAKVNKRYKSYLSNITSTNALLKFFKGKRLNEIHPFMVERYKKARLETVKPASMNRDLTCMKHMFNMAISWSLSKENPVNKVKLLKEEPRDVKTLTHEKEKELVNILCEESASRHV
jgi:site-specific recombinase XerC